MFEFKPGRYVSRVLFAGSPLAASDLFGVLWRDPGEAWVFSYRFRYYASADPHDDRDEKSGWRATFPRGVAEDEAVRKVREVFGAIARVGLLGEVDEVAVETADEEEATRKIIARPWAHVRPDQLGGKVGEA